MDKSFDFDRTPDRRNGDSHKWNRYAKFHHDVIGAWVADMDFLASPAVIEAVHKRLDGPALGYSEPRPELVDVVLERLERLYQWCVHPSWLVALPGIVPGLYGAARAAGVAGDNVITQSPNYHHFFKAAELSDRQLLRLNNRIVNGRWQMDFDHLKQLAGKGASSFLLCNPHNPVGRILTREELQAVADICLQNDILMCSDEIHAELLLDKDKPHIPIASLSTQIEQQSITLISPSKAFNLPGIGGFALAIIPNPEIRKAFEKQLYGVAVHPSALAFEAALAAWRDSSDWQRQLLDYLRGNRDLVEQRIARMPGLSMTHVEATFLAWINAKDLRLDNPANHFLLHGVALSGGAEMGEPNYLRLNFASTRATLEDMLSRMEKAISALADRELYQGGETMSEITEARQWAVSSAMNTVREISPKGAAVAISREGLNQIETRLAELTSVKDLFSEEHYPNPPAESQGYVYLIAEDKGHENSLYLVCANGSANVPPHDHKTWAAIAGLTGEEENTLYDRTEDGVKAVGKITLREGDTLSLMPEDLHSIKAIGGSTRHLHWYGRGFSEQVGKTAFVNGAWIDVPADMIPVDESRRVI